jgi:hypothetical protein
MGYTLLFNEIYRFRWIQLLADTRDLKSAYDRTKTIS